MFGLLKEKAAVTVEMHGYVFDVSVHMYSDVRGFAAGCVVIQMRNGIPYPVLYDAFTLVHAQKKYGTYKRELCVIVEFCRRHSHVFQAHETSIIALTINVLPGSLIRPIMREFMLAGLLS